MQQYVAKHTHICISTERDDPNLLIKRVLMGVPSYQLTTNFSANCQLTTYFS